MNTVYLVRHGEAESNLTHEFSYRKVDLPLTSKGRQQALQTAKAFTPQSIDEIYCSPLNRTRQTAEAIAKACGLPVTVVENFREVNVGDLEGMPDLDEAWHINFNIWNRWSQGDYSARYPGGEDWHTLFSRTVEGLCRVLDGKQDHRIVVVAHGGIITATLARLVNNLDEFALFRLPNHNCSITEARLGLSDGQIYGEMICWSDIRHLSGEAADLVPGVRED